MEISFDGQVVVVTGAGGGLGRTYALELARRGAAVVVNDLAGADEVVAEVEAAGGRAVSSPDSVATPEGGQAIVDTAVDAFGTVDAVIHNAGAWRHVPYEEMTADNLDPVLDVHLRGAFFVTRPAWAVMQAKGNGRLVLTSSSSGVFGRESGSNYAAAKAGMLGLARVFIGLTEGWLGPPDQDLTAEDVAAHLDEIEDRSAYSLPASAWDELRGLAEAIAGKG